MKKIILSLVAVMALGSINAQESKQKSAGFSKGDVIISGAVGFTSSENTGSNYKEGTYNFSPNAGYFVTDNFALGLGLVFSGNSTQTSPNAPKVEQTNTGFEAIGRYYFTPANKFSVFAQAGVSYVTSKVNTSNVTASGFGFGVAPGINYFLTDNFAIQTSLGLLSYTSAKADFPGAVASTNFNIGIDFSQTRFGVLYKF